MSSERPAIVLLSGGLDSATTLAIAKAEGHALHALTMSYGQRHTIEIACARAIAKRWGCKEHIELEIDLRRFGKSALTADIEVPKGKSPKAIGEGIPVTYVPARNTIFLAYALAWAEVTGAMDIFIGVNAVDYSGYPDCRPEFIEAFESTANLATRIGVEGRERIRIRAPLLHMSKGEIVGRGLSLGVDYSMTSTCYDPDGQGIACGECDACRLRLQGFAEAGVADPVAYQPRGR